MTCKVIVDFASKLLENGDGGPIKSSQSLLGGSSPFGRPSHVLALCVLSCLCVVGRVLCHEPVAASNNSSPAQVVCRRLR